MRRWLKRIPSIGQQTNSLRYDDEPMKKLTAILLAFLFVAGHSSRAIGQAQTESAIDNIRREYAAINKRTNRYKKVKKTLSGLSLEGGQLVAYSDGAAIVKIVATHYGEMGRTLEEYYYSNGKLIFMFEKILHYNKPLSGKVVHTMESRYYFDNDKMIRLIDENGKDVDAGSEEFRMKEKELLETSNLFVAGARSKNPAIER